MLPGSLLADRKTGNAKQILIRTRSIVKCENQLNHFVLTWFQVYCVDEGHREVVDIARLRLMVPDSKLVSLPAQAVHCVLSGVKSQSDVWHEGMFSGLRENRGMMFYFHPWYMPTICMCDVFRPSATLCRIGLMESRTCHCRGGPSPPGWLIPPPKLHIMMWAALWSHV